jgi:murein DD-endopeptidase MepM/ murein hydrolase activator NlpD
VHPLLPLAAAAVAGVALVGGTPAAPEPPVPTPAAVDTHPWRAPLAPLTLVAGYDPPAVRWLAGHRGLDLRGAFGQQVLAVDDGLVTVAGPVAGRGVVTVRHGPIRSTYEPVTALVTVGDRVRAGQPIGLLADGGHCRGCLHLGARRGEDYLDPWRLISPGARLLPTPASPR